MADKPKILIIDDEHDIVYSLSVRLRASGYEVVSASDGTGSTDLVREMEIAPNCILLDVNMPGKDGLAVLRDLKGNWHTRRIPVIVVSASATDVLRSRAVAAGAHRLVSKPFDSHKLLGALNEVVGSDASSAVRA